MLGHSIRIHFLHGRHADGLIIGRHVGHELRVAVVTLLLTVGSRVLKQALLLLHLDVELLQEGQVLEDLVKRHLGVMKVDSFGLAAAHEAKGHDGLGDAGERELVAVHVPGVWNQNGDWHLFGLHLLPRVEIEHALFIAEVYFLFAGLVAERQALCERPGRFAERVD